MASTKVQKNVPKFEIVSEEVPTIPPAEVVEKVRSAEPKVLPPKEKVLSEAHLRVLENAQSEVKTAQLEMVIAEQVLLNHRLQLENLKLLVDRQELVLSDRATAYHNTKLKYVGITTQVFESYGVIGDSVSYDSVTGKIV